MGAMASQITSLTIVYSGADQRKHQSSASLAFVRGIHRCPVNSPHKWPETRKMFLKRHSTLRSFNTYFECSVLLGMSSGSLFAKLNRKTFVISRNSEIRCYNDRTVMKFNRHRRSAALLPRRLSIFRTTGQNLVHAQFYVMTLRFREILMSFGVLNQRGWQKDSQWSMMHALLVGWSK